MGWTALHYAVFASCAEAVQLLLLYGASTNAANFRRHEFAHIPWHVGTTPLMLAAAVNSHVIARLLLQAHVSFRPIACMIFDLISR